MALLQSNYVISSRFKGTKTLSSSTTGYRIKRNGVPTKAKFLVRERQSGTIVGGGVSNEDGTWEVKNLSDAFFFRIETFDETGQLNSAAYDWAKPEEVVEDYRNVTYGLPTDTTFEYYLKDRNMFTEGQSLLHFGRFIDDSFASDDGQITHYTESTGSSDYSIASHELILNPDGNGGNDIFVINNVEDIKVPHFFIRTYYDDIDGGGGIYETGPGIAKDENNFIFAVIDKPSDQVYLIVKIDGTRSILGTVSEPSSGIWDDDQLALSLIGNQARVWYQEDGGSWQLLSEVDISSEANFLSFDFTGWKPALYHNCDSAENTRFAYIIGGYSKTGWKIKSQSIVTNLDGRPKFFNSKDLMLLVTIEEDSEVFSSPHEFSVICGYNPYLGTIVPYRLLMIDRGGQKNFDTLGQLICENEDKWHLFISTTSTSDTSGYEILYKEINENIGIAVDWSPLIVDTLTTLNLDSVEGYPKDGAYSPSAYYDGSAWNIVYTYINHNNSDEKYPVVETSTDLLSFSVIPSGSSNQLDYEYSQFVPIQDSYYIVSNNTITGEVKLYSDSLNEIDSLSFDVSGTISIGSNPISSSLSLVLLDKIPDDSDEFKFHACGSNSNGNFESFMADAPYTLNGGTLPEPDLTISQHYPQEGYIGQYIVFIGTGFNESIDVAFADTSAQNLIYKNSNVFYAQSPVPSSPGFVDLIIDRGDSSETIVDGFYYLSQEELPILNGDAEDGLNNWNVTNSGMTTTDNPANDVGPFDGFCFYGGNSDSFSKANQTVDLPSSFDSIIDTGNVEVRLSWYQSSYSNSDKAEIAYEFLDDTGTSIGGEVSNGLIATTEDAWTYREYVFDVPIGARQIVFYMIFDRIAGSNNNGYVDNITADIREKPSS